MLHQTQDWINTQDTVHKDFTISSKEENRTAIFYPYVPVIKFLWKND